MAILYCGQGLFSFAKPTSYSLFCAYKNVECDEYIVKIVCYVNEYQYQTSKFCVVTNLHHWYIKWTFPEFENAELTESF